MESNPSRRLFLRRSGVVTVIPVIAPVLPIEKVVKYFFAPAAGWNSDNLVFSARDLVLSIEDFGSRLMPNRFDVLFGFNKLTPDWVLYEGSGEGEAH